MYIHDIHVDGFGVWSDLTIPDLPEGLVAIYGPNEAGKSTLLEFIRAMWCGLPEGPTSYLQPHAAEVAGGSFLISDREPYRLSRRRNGTGPQEVRLAVRRGRGWKDVDARERLHRWAGPVDASIYCRVFAVGLTEIQELTTLQDTDAAEMLYKLAGGIDRVSLVDTLDHLRSAACQWSNPDGDGVLDQLRVRERQLMEQLDERQRAADGWSEVNRRRAEVDQRIGGLRDQVDAWEREARSIELALSVRERWQERAGLLAVLPASANDGPGAPHAALCEQLAPLQRQLEDCARRERLWNKRRRAATRKARALHWNKRLQALLPRIEALCEQELWLESLERQVQRLREDVGDAAGEAVPAATHAPTPSTSNSPRVPERVLESLRGPARKVRSAIRRLQESRSEEQRLQQEAAELGNRLEEQLLEVGQEDLQEALAQAQQKAEKIRRRVSLEERIDRLTRQRKELDREAQELVERQVLPVQTLALLGIPFVLGVTLILAGLFWPASARLGWPVAVLGLAGWVVAVVTKVVLERSAAQDLDECSEQHETLTRQLKAAREELEQLDGALPVEAGSWDQRLQSAESQLEQLEQLLPLDASHQAAVQRVAATARRREQHEEELRAARQSWRSALRRHGLPEDLAPASVRQRLEEDGRTMVQREWQERFRQDLDMRQRELEMLTGRIRQIAREADLPVLDDRPRALLRQLAGAVEQQRAHAEDRRRLQRKARIATQRYRRAREERAAIEQQRRQLLVASGVTNEVELTRMLEEQERLQATHLRCRHLTTEIQTALAGQCTEDEVQQQLDRGQLEERWEEVLRDAQAAQEELTGLHEERGALLQQARAAGEDRRAHELRFDLNVVRHEIAQAEHHWRVLTATRETLEILRDDFEKQRQPQTLRDASRYLEQLTTGQYLRVWTPMDERVLYVEDAGNRSLPLEVLSRGTREAVFLCLRLALVNDFGRRSVKLPVVMDDVLVNLDASRVRAAIQLLADFAAQGHQIFFFTCHLHLAEALSACGVAVRELPARPRPGLILDSNGFAAVMPLADNAPSRSALPVADPLPAADQVDLDDEVEEVSDNEVEDDDAVWEDEAEDELADVEDDSYDEESSDESEDEEADDGDEAYEEDEYEEEDAYEDEEYDEDEYEDDEYEEDEYEEDESDEEHDVADAPGRVMDVGLVDGEAEVDGAAAEREAPLTEDDPGDRDERTHPRSFAWPSPERWWDDREGEAA